MNELKQCPFCGGNAHTCKQISGYYVYCDNLDCLAAVHFTSMNEPREDTIKRWNQRVIE